MGLPTVPVSVFHEENSSSPVVLLVLHRSHISTQESKKVTEAGHFERGDFFFTVARPASVLPLHETNAILLPRRM